MIIDPFGVITVVEIFSDGYVGIVDDWTNIFFKKNPGIDTLHQIRIIIATQQTIKTKETFFRFIIPIYNISVNLYNYNVLHFERFKKIR